MPTTQEAPKGAKLMTAVLNVARGVVLERFHPDPDQVKSFLNTRRMTTFELANAPVLPPVESNGYFYSGLLEGGMTEDILNRFYFKRPDEYDKRFKRGDVLWQPQSPGFQVSDRLRDGLRNDNLLTRSEIALHLGVEALRYNIEAAAPERELAQREHWQQRAQEVVYAEFDEAFQAHQDKAGNIDPKTKGLIQDGLVDLLYNPRIIFSAIGGKVVLSYMEQGIKTTEYTVQENRARHEEVITALSAEPQTELVKRLIDMGLDLKQGVVAKNIYVQDMRPKLVHRKGKRGGEVFRSYPIAVQTRFRDHGMGSRQNLQEAFMTSTIPERLERLQIEDKT